MSRVRISSPAPIPNQPLAHIAQLVERVLGKDEVTSSNLVVGSDINGNGPRSLLPATQAQLPHQGDSGSNRNTAKAPSNANTTATVGDHSRTTTSTTHTLGASSGPESGTTR